MIPGLPENDNLIPDFEEVLAPSKNYYLHHNLEHINGTIDEAEALKQAIFMMLSVERYDHMIYSFNFGVELNNLIGKPKLYVASEAPRRITEALMIDDRILGVEGFEITMGKESVLLRFIVRSIYGELEQGREVLF